MRRLSKCAAAVLVEAVYARAGDGARTAGLEHLQFIAVGPAQPASHGPDPQETVAVLDDAAGVLDARVDGRALDDLPSSVAELLSRPGMRREKGADDQRSDGDWEPPTLAVSSAHAIESVFKTAFTRQGRCRDLRRSSR